MDLVANHTSNEVGIFPLKRILGSPSNELLASMVSRITLKQGQRKARLVLLETS